MSCTKTDNQQWLFQQLEVIANLQQRLNSFVKITEISHPSLGEQKRFLGIYLKQTISGSERSE